MGLASNHINVLGIESSCDDTGVAIVNQNGDILSNCIKSQLKRHLDHGGIIPVLAKEYHLDNIDGVAKEAFAKSGLKSVEKDIHAIAVATRPGLQFSLQIGLSYARKLAQKYAKPLIPIHHMQAHSLMPLLQNRLIKFPYLTLLLSGGHCLLAMAKTYDKFEILGATLDDAPGDLLDKFARRYRLRNLGSPFDSICGGAAIELLAKRENADKFKYFNGLNTVPMIKRRSCEFSFSGYRGIFDILDPIIDGLWLTGNQDKLMDELSHACASLQRAILLQLVKKLQRAHSYYRMHWRYANEDAFSESDKHSYFGVRNIDDPLEIVVSGGVAANSYIIENLRLAFRECIDDQVQIYAPTKDLCSDNGLMIAWNGLLRYQDFLNNNQKFKLRDLKESVIVNSNDMKHVDVESQSMIGLDLSEQLRLASVETSRLKHPEYGFN